VGAAVIRAVSVARAGPAAERACSGAPRRQQRGAAAGAALAWACQLAAYQRRALLCRSRAGRRRAFWAPCWGRRGLPRPRLRCAAPRLLAAQQARIKREPAKERRVSVERRTGRLAAGDALGCVLTRKGGAATSSVRSCPRMLGPRTAAAGQTSAAMPCTGPTSALGPAAPSAQQTRTALESKITLCCALIKMAVAGVAAWCARSCRPRIT